MSRLQHESRQKRRLEDECALLENRRVLRQNFVGIPASNLSLILEVHMSQNETIPLLERFKYKSHASPCVASTAQALRPGNTRMIEGAAAANPSNDLIGGLTAYNRCAAEPSRRSSNQADARPSLPGSDQGGCGREREFLESAGREKENSRRSPQKSRSSSGGDSRAVLGRPGGHLLGGGSLPVGRNGDGSDHGAKRMLFQFSQK